MRHAIYGCYTLYRHTIQVMQLYFKSLSYLIILLILSSFFNSSLKNSPNGEYSTFVTFLTTPDLYSKSHQLNIHICPIL